MAENAFSDLVPKSAPKTTGGNAFADLVPKDPLAGAKRTLKGAEKKVGGALAYGHQHPFESFMNVMGAPQRALQSFETGGNLLDMGHAAMHPEMGQRLTQQVKKNIGLTGLEAGPLAGNDLGHKLARGTLDTGLDILNDPMTVAPVGKVLELGGRAARAVPGVARAAEAVAAGPIGQGVSRVFNPEHYMRGLTPEAKAKFEMATNRSMEAARARQVAEDAIVKRNAAAIRAGHMPDEVAQLFGPGDAWKEHFIDKETGAFKFGPGTRPQDVEGALFRHRAPMFEQGVRDQLGGGIFKGSPDAFHVPANASETERAARVRATQERLAQAIKAKGEPPGEHGLLAKAARGFTHRGNQAFLVNPIPHTLNLTNLAYNRYGLPTTLAGLGNAARVMAGKTGGKLGENIGELEQLGAKSQYGNLFDELGLTRILGIPGTEGAAKVANKAIVPLERASNYAQRKVLNSTETGLRAAALNAEKKAGRTGAAAAKSIHSAFGTDAPNAVVQGAQHIGAPFARFHLQTAPGSGLKTLATHPARVLNPIKAQRDENAQINPSGPKYTSSIPAMSTARLLTQPQDYLLGSLGPLTAIRDAKEQLDKGKYLGMASDALQRFVPGTPEYTALMYLLSKKKGRAGQSGLQELGPAIFGGYYKK